MNNFDPNSMEFSIQQAMKLAQTPEGQQLIAALKKEAGSEVQNAVKKAAAGNMEDAKQTVSSLLKHPEIRSLLDKLGR